MATEKPKLNYKQQVNHLINKGIIFNKISEAEAVQYLSSHNNFFKLMSYRKNYPKNEKSGKYMHMDFAHMIDLARIDTRLRVILLEMCLNIEHFSKVELLNIVTNSSSEDGYSIVHDYINSLTDTQKHTIDNEIQRCSNSIYLEDLYDKYREHLPVWAFLEMISFGQFIYFYGYCAERFDNARMRDKKYMLLSVRKIRIAAAHNNCLINDMHTYPTQHKISLVILKELSSIGINQKQRYKRMHSERIYLITLCLFLHKECVPSSGTNQIVSKKLYELSNRFFRDFDYKDNNLIQSTFSFIQKLIDTWY